MAIKLKVPDIKGDECAKKLKKNSEVRIQESE